MYIIIDLYTYFKQRVDNIPPIQILHCKVLPHLLLFHILYLIYSFYLSLIHTK